MNSLVNNITALYVMVKCIIIEYFKIISGTVAQWFTLSNLINLHLHGSVIVKKISTCSLLRNM